MDKAQKEEQPLSVSIKRKHEAVAPVSLKKKQEVASTVTLRKKEADAISVSPKMENTGKTAPVVEPVTSKKLTQEKVIAGRVLDGAGNPVVGAAIQIVGTARGTATDANGDYSIRIDNSETYLKVSAAGLETQTISVADVSIGGTIRLKPFGNSQTPKVKTGFMKKYWWGVLALVLVVIVWLLFRNCGGEGSDIILSSNERQVENNQTAQKEDSQYGDNTDVNRVTSQSDEASSNVSATTSAEMTNSVGAENGSGSLVKPSQEGTSKSTEKVSTAKGEESIAEETKLFSFAFGEVQGTATSELKALIEQMKSDVALKVTVIGYTDQIGDPVYNKWLSERRADSVKGILVNSGIDGNRIKVIGGGVSTRYSTNAENRRAVLIQK